MVFGEAPAVIGQPQDASSRHAYLVDGGVSEACLRLLAFVQTL